MEVRDRSSSSMRYGWPVRKLFATRLLDREKVPQARESGITRILLIAPPKMPERVHTRFEDDPAVEEPVQSVPEPVESKTQSKKRKRAEKNGTSEVPAKRKNAQASIAQEPQVQPPQKATALPERPEPSANKRPNGRERQTYAQKRAQVEALAQEKRAKLQAQEPRIIPHKSLSDKSKELLKTRKELPIWNHKDRIRQALQHDKNVMLLVGETGSGKSTQVPQFLLNEPWCRGTIAITQPRRVAAVSLARRVAEEMGTPLGSASPASKVGYSVRFDTSVSPSTKIKFLTEGMLLQEMLRDPSLRQYSAVVVDEVHERSVNVDLILGFLRNLINGDQKGRKGKPLKVVVMSATADVESLFNFFNPDPATTSSVKEIEAGDEKVGDSSDDEDSDKSLTNLTAELPAELERLAKASKSISICHIEGRQYPVQTTYLPIPVQDFVEEALKTIFRIHQREPLPGDILVFLTGQDTVEGLERLVNEYAASMDTKFPKVSLRNLRALLDSNQAVDPHSPIIRCHATSRATEDLPASSTKDAKSHLVNQYRRNLSHRSRRPLRN